MLLELRIRNFAIIEEASLQFGPALNVLSGETGAGKTIVMTALSLLLGARGSPEMVRLDSREAVVEGLFSVEGEAALDLVGGGDFMPSAQGELLIRRTIAEGGRSRATINGDLATVNTLARLSANLVQIFGQHEQQSLLDANSHRQILDNYAGLHAPLADYHETWQRVTRIRAELDTIDRRERERGELLDLARFRAAELERAALTPGEDDELAAARAVLANAARLSAAAQEALELLYGSEASAVDSIGRARIRLAEAAAIDPSLSEPLAQIAAACAGLEEGARFLQSYASRVEADPARLEEIDNRLDELTRLKRKYGGSLAAALEALERSRQEVAELEGAASSRARMERELDDSLAELHRKAGELTIIRRRAGRELQVRMEAELRTLGMRNATFEAKLEALADGAGMIYDGLKLGPAGAEGVEFLFSANLGQPPLALGRTASGGELSRVMLALKRLEAQRRGIATMIFDEVDAGIGGAIAAVVGRKLKELSKFHQILCITHLPQIAAFAGTHFRVEKEERRGATRSTVTMLEPRERSEEIARMLGGAEVTDKLRRAARELLSRSSSE